MEEYKYLWCMMNDQLNYCARMVEERANCVTVLVSFDVISPFTNVPVDLEVKVAHEGLSAGTSMAECTVLSADQVANLLHFCLDATTLLAYKGEYYQQTYGTAMGSPDSVSEAKLVMEDVEKRVLSTYPLPLPFWKRYVDDTLTAFLGHKDHGPL